MLEDNIPILTQPRSNNTPSQKELLEKDSTETVQAIYLFKKLPSLISPNLRVLHQFKFRPAILVEGSVSQLRELTQKENKNLITVVENQKTSSILSSPPIHPYNQLLGIENVREEIGANILHSLGYDGTGIRIGVIDTGVDSSHPDFEGRVIAEESFVKTIFGYSVDVIDPSDEQGHGTWVAGIAAGKEYGIAPNASIISAKIFGNNSVAGNGNVVGEETTAAILAAIDFCVEQGADIINLSIGQYHNLPTSLRQEYINSVSLTNKTIFAIAAGNSGYNGIDGGTVNNPGTALQAITVAAAMDLHSMASFSGTGPKPDYSMKPDISAPGVFVLGPKNGGGFKSGSGTSAATPIVAGASALLLQYAKGNGYLTTPGTIKAALMSAAVPMTAGTIPFPIWRQGAGFLNVAQAYVILKDSLTGSSFDIIYTHPRKLPFDPFTKLFKGQKWTFNLTVIVSGTKNITLEATNPTLEIEIPSIVEIKDSQLVEVKFSALPTSENIVVLDNIKATTHLGATTDIQIQGKISTAEAFVLIDEAHQVIVPRPDDSSAETIFGDNSNIYGAFREFTLLMESATIAVTPYLGPELNSTILNGFDLFIMLDPFSYNYDIFTDWILPQDYTFLSFTENEISALQKWMNGTGSVLIATRGNETVYLPALNDFISPYGISVQYDYIANTWDYNLTEPFSETGIYAGPSVMTDSESFIFATCFNKNLMVGHEESTGSRLLVIGTDYCFDYYAFHGYYGYAVENNKRFVYDMISWVLNASISPEITTNQSNKNRFDFIIYGFFVILPVWAIIRRRKKKIS